MTKRKNPELRKKEIMEIALSHFNNKGYYKTSLEDIAGEVGITKPGIYYHFKSKKNLFIELFRYKVDSYFEAVSVNTSSEESVPRRIRRYTEKSEKLFQKNIEILKFCIEFFSMGTRDEDIKKEVTALYRKRIAVFGNIIRQGQDAGVLKELDPESMARALYFMSMGAFFVSFSTNTDFDPVDQNAVSMEVIFEGMKKKTPM